ncbi:MAG: vWA domain-containing protein [Pseudomonadota bacterium]
MTLLSPLGLLVALAAVPLVAAWLVADRRVARVRAALGLPPPAGDGRRRVAALVAVPVLLALACAQPALTRDETRRVRTDAAAMVVVDVSRSMQAAAAPGAPTRLERARTLATRLRADLGDVPTGVASMTDRVLPLLLPSADPAAFDATVERALTDAAGGNLFLPSDRRRALVVLTDGESQPFAEGEVARALRAAHIRLVTVHVSAPGERVFRRGGVPERLYRQDARSGETLDALAEATGGAAVEEGDLPGAAAAVRAALGRGETRAYGVDRRLVPLAPWLALLALAPLLLLVLPGGVRWFPKGLQPRRPGATIAPR